MDKVDTQALYRTWRDRRLDEYGEVNSDYDSFRAGWKMAIQHARNTHLELDSCDGACRQFYLKELDKLEF